jgi:hypothetical protein
MSKDKEHSLSVEVGQGGKGGGGWKAQVEEVRIGERASITRGREGQGEGSAPANRIGVTELSEGGRLILRRNYVGIGGPCRAGRPGRHSSTGPARAARGMRSHARSALPLLTGIRPPGPEHVPQSRPPVTSGGVRAVSLASRLITRLLPWPTRFPFSLFL